MVYDLNDVGEYLEFSVMVGLTEIKEKKHIRDDLDVHIEEYDTIEDFEAQIHELYQEWVETKTAQSWRYL